LHFDLSSKDASFLSEPTIFPGNNHPPSHLIVGKPQPEGPMWRTFCEVNHKGKVDFIACSDNWTQHTVT
jgi:hypothetical protein